MITHEDGVVRGDAGLCGDSGKLAGDPSGSEESRGQMGEESTLGAWPGRLVKPLSIITTPTVIGRVGIRIQLRLKRLASRGGSW